MSSSERSINGIPDAESAKLIKKLGNILNHSIVVRRGLDISIQTATVVDADKLQAMLEYVDKLYELLEHIESINDLTE